MLHSPGRPVVDRVRSSPLVHSAVPGYASREGSSWRPEASFHLHMVSDSTGETLITVGRAVAAQYPAVSALEHVYPMVRSERQLDQVIAEIEASPGVVLYTLVEETLSERLERFCRDSGSPAMSVLRPIIDLFRSYLGVEVLVRPGAQHVLNADYFRRIDALNYTMMHDDGQLVRRSRRGRRRADGCVAHLEDARPRSTSPTAASRPPMCRSFPACRCRPRSSISSAPGRRPDRLARAHRADPRESRALAQRATGFDRLYGSSRRLRRDRPVAPPVRRERLAGHRRDAPLDRGNGGGDHGACSRSIAVPGSSKHDRLPPAARRADLARPRLPLAYSAGAAARAGAQSSQSPGDGRTGA